MFESIDAAMRRDDNPSDRGLPQGRDEGGERVQDVRRALWVALIVGSVLNLINQGEAVLLHHSVNWLKAVLTYMVPFFVSLHGAHWARKP